MENQTGQVTVVDSGMNVIADLNYPGVVLFAGFDQPGKRLLVLTSKQEVFVDDLP